MKKSILIWVLLLLAIQSFAQIPNGYYDNATGKFGEDLRAALRDVTTNGHVKLPYTSSNFDVWDAYAYTDVRPAPNNTIIWDMYSDVPGGSPAYTFTLYTNQCGTASQEGDCYSREHVMPNSWWGGFDDASNPQYSDLHHLFPADQYVNNMKSAHIVAETSSPTWTSSNGSKVGPCSFPGYTGTVFEPIAEYKGDFARAFLYLATRYMDKLSTWITNFTTTEGQYIIETSGGNYKTWYINQLITWHIADPVSEKEINRNNAIYYNTPQHNRNPYVDHPEYVCLVWGCSFNPIITNISASPGKPNSGESVLVSANITDNGTISEAIVEWCTDGVSFNNSIAMNLEIAPTYAASSLIPNQPGGTVISYRIKATDDEANVSISSNYSYTVIKAEPANYPTNFVFSASTTNSITLAWTDAVNSEPIDGYLIKANNASFDFISNPLDGQVVPNTTLSINVSTGAQTITFTGLVSSTTYYFKIFPFTNSLTNINYKTDGVVPSASGTTLTVGIQDITSNQEIKLYPNPVDDELDLELSGNYEKVEYEVIDITGKKLSQGIFYQKTKIPTTDFSPGIYCLILKHNNKVDFKYFIKQ